MSEATGAIGDSELRPLCQSDRCSMFNFGLAVTNITLKSHWPGDKIIGILNWPSEIDIGNVADTIKHHPDLNKSTLTITIRPTCSNAFLSCWPSCTH
jgi:hypothetical protein